MQKNQTLPITHPVNVARLPQKGMPVKLIANEKERAALAKDHALVSVDSFEAELLVSKWRRDGVKITGKVKADIVQTCSITLEPLLASIENEIEAVFVPETSKLAKPKFDADGEMVLDANGPDAPETFSGDTLDVGLIAEEFFELAINPYPRKEGAELEVNDTGADNEPIKVSPFAKLASLKQKQ
jgi:uncharacterized metal-binding protein YceD (DUF177 family)